MARGAGTRVLSASSHLPRRRKTGQEEIATQGIRTQHTGAGQELLLSLDASGGHSRSMVDQSQGTKLCRLLLVQVGRESVSATLR